jgi:hypothetical protein
LVKQSEALPVLPGSLSLVDRQVRRRAIVHSKPSTEEKPTSTPTPLVSTRPWRLTHADDALIGLPVGQHERRSRQGRLSSRYRSAQRQIVRPGAHCHDGERLES